MQIPRDNLNKEINKWCKDTKNSATGKMSNFGIPFLSEMMGNTFMLFAVLCCHWFYGRAKAQGQKVPKKKLEQYVLVMGAHSFVVKYRGDVSIESVNENWSDRMVSQAIQVRKEVLALLKPGLDGSDPIPLPTGQGKTQSPAYFKHLL